MMEGLGQEAASLAGHLRLGNLCWIYDSNRVTIEGPTDLAFSEDVQARFRAYGWQVRHVADVTDLAALRAGLGRGPAGRAADAHRGGHGHRRRRADQAGHRGGAQRAARSRRDARGQAVLRLAGGRVVPGAGRGLPAVRRGCRRARAAGPGAVGRDAGGLPGGPPGARGGTRHDDSRDAAARLGQRAARVLFRRWPGGRARGEPAGAERHRRRGCPGCSAARPTSPRRPRAG